MEVPFIQMMRTPETLEIFKHPKTFILLAQIAYRARRTNSIIDGLEPGEALIGDHGSIGLSQQEYRTAKKNLVNWKIITTRTTNKGTIARLINSSIFNINCEPVNNPDNKSLTTGQQASNKPATTNKNVRSKECKNDKKINTHFLLDYLISQIEPSGNGLKTYQDKITEFYRYRQKKPKAKRYQSEKSIVGFIRDCRRCLEIYADLGECLDITMERGWMTPDPEYLEGKVKTIEQQRKDNGEVDW